MAVGIHPQSEEESKGRRAEPRSICSSHFSHKCTLHREERGRGKESRTRQLRNEYFRVLSHLGDLWDLGGVDGPAALRHGHGVPGLFSRRARFPLFPLISGIYEAQRDKSTRASQKAV